VLVLRGLWRAWSGLRVFPLSCPLHYPAVSCKPAATLGPHLGASVGPMLSLIVLIGSANENSFCYIVDPPIFVLALLCIHRTIEKHSNNFTWHCLVRIFGNILSMSMSMSKTRQDPSNTFFLLLAHQVEKI
jgi:hypothetical protein